MRDRFAPVAFPALSINLLTALPEQRRIADVAWRCGHNWPGGMIRCWRR